MKRAQYYRRVEMHRNSPFNPNGGLTIVAMTGFEDIAYQVAAGVQKKGRKRGNFRTPVDVVIPTLVYYGSGEPKVRLGKKHIGGHDVIILTSGPGTPKMLVELTSLLGYVARRRARRIIVITAYFPMARSDKDDERELAMPPIWVDAWQGASKGKLDRMVCVDPHSDHVTSAGGGGFVTPIKMTRRLLMELVEQALQQSEHVVLSFPDNTSRKRFKAALKDLKNKLGRKLPIVYASADRDEDGKLIDEVAGQVDAIPGSLVVQLDDETASGGTQIDVARMLKAMGASSVWGGVTHGVLCDNAVERFSAPDCPIDRLYINDTIIPSNRPELVPLIESGRLRVLSWLNDLIWVVYKLHWDEDVRELR